MRWLRNMVSGDTSARARKRFAPLIADINEREASLCALSDSELKERTEALRTELKEGHTLEDVLPAAYALVRESAQRTLNQRHFDVQLLGGILLHHHSIAEMRTGEGKTLVATLPAYLNALEGKGVHVVTVNDYLARRDSVWMGQVYALLGLSVGVINSDSSYLYDPTHLPQGDAGEELERTRDTLGAFKVQHEFLRPVSRREAYAADITYGTNSEFGFDYLRDHIEYRPEELRQRGHHFAIVDEIDSILIDEARTPLIISAPAEEGESLYEVFARVVRGLKDGTHYTLDEKRRAVTLTDAGIEVAERALNIDNIYTEQGMKFAHHLETAVRAKALFKRDKEYVVRDGEVVIVDEFTGRLQPGRRWSEGLHQAIEAKEGVSIQKESRTFASITYQNFFRLYRKLSGMTGTAATSAEEFFKVYGLEVVTVPTNMPVAREDRDDLIFQTEQGKFKAIAKTVQELHKKGQPVLIGTASIEKNELLSSYLKQVGVPHEVLNAKNHEREGEIIAQAGALGKVTIATNMAGRGVDIKLGGVPGSRETYEKVKGLGGLFVLGTERHEARRIDNQLRGRSGRQGDPGETQFYVSLEDDLMRVFASDMIKTMMGKFGIPEDEPIKNTLITRSLESAQTKIEGFNFDRRKEVLAYDDVVNKQRTALYLRRERILLSPESELDNLFAELIQKDAELLAVAHKRKEELKDEAYYRGLRLLLLRSIDMLWMEHLEQMDYMRSSVHLRAYGQRDPLVEYQKEASRLFKHLEERLLEMLTSVVPRLGESAPSVPQINRRVHVPTPHSRKLGRNDVVRITNGVEEKTIKWKRAEELVKSGEWKLLPLA
jgi:preprotein translocase subunit SecA